MLHDAPVPSAWFSVVVDSEDPARGEMDLRFTRLNESDEYRRQREELRVAELDLIDHVERVAELA